MLFLLNESIQLQTARIPSLARVSKLRPLKGVEYMFGYLPAILLRQLLFYRSISVLFIIPLSLPFFYTISSIAMKTRLLFSTSTFICTFLMLSMSVNIVEGQIVKRQSKISDTQGGFTGILGEGTFGSAMAYLGDLNGDGHGDLAIGEVTSVLSFSTGSVWILFLDANGNVSNHQQIGAGMGGFTGILEKGDGFGYSITNIGDFDGDGVTDLAVGARGDDDGGADRGALWLLYLNSDGTVKAHDKISDTEGGFAGMLDDSDYFGRSATSLGDMDGDGVIDLAVGASRDDDGSIDRKFITDLGATWILFMNEDGTVKSHQKISATQGGFSGPAVASYHFGTGFATLGDLDGDSVTDIAVSATGDSDGGARTGAIWVLFLNKEGTVKAQQKISASEGSFSGRLESLDLFGISLAHIGDVNKDGIPDLAVGANGDDDGCSATGFDVSNCSHGAIWILLLNNDGTVKNHTKISDTYGNFRTPLDDFDQFGISVTAIGDQDSDGYTDLAVGVLGDDDGAPNKGALWLLKLKASSILPPRADTADDQLRELAYKVEDLVDDELIIKVTGDLLTSSVEGALDVLQSGYWGSTQFYMEGFIGQVEKFVSTGYIPSVEGDVLINEATAVIALIDEIISGLSEKNPTLQPSKLDVDLPAAFDLHQNHPNPFTGATSIRFTLQENSQVRLSVYDLLGREVERVLDNTREAGSHTIQFNAGDLPSGTYLYRLDTKEGTRMRMMVVL